MTSTSPAAGSFPCSNMYNAFVKVLLVEDDEDDYLVIRELLKQAWGAQHELHWIADFEAALAALRQEAHDVCLVDYRLSANSGLELLRRAIAQGSKAPIIMLTGQGDRELDIEAMASGAADYLVKGMQRPDSLERAIRYAVSRRAAEMALRQSEQQQRIILNNIDEAVYRIARAEDGRWPDGMSFVSDGVRRLIGYSPREFMLDSRLLLRIAQAADRAAISQQMDARFSATVSSTVQFCVIHKTSAQVLWIEDKVVPQLNDAGEVISLIGILRDVTQSKTEQDKLIYAAFHDRLTGLPNRTLFMDRLASVIHRGKRNGGGQWALLFLDLNGFKTINDTLGHEAGDQVLVTTGRLIRDCLRSGDTLARLAGDEFVVLLDDMSSQEDAEHVCARILKTLSKPYSIGGRDFLCSASIGVARGDRGYAQPEDVLRDADTAMYHAKVSHRADGAAHARVYEAEMGMWSKPAPVAAREHADRRSARRQRRLAPK